jgi:hypothetical protein
MTESKDKDPLKCIIMGGEDVEFRTRPQVISWMRLIWIKFLMIFHTDHKIYSSTKKEELESEYIMKMEQTYNIIESALGLSKDYLDNFFQWLDHGFLLFKPKRETTEIKTFANILGFLVTVSEFVSNQLIKTYSETSLSIFKCSSCGNLFDKNFYHSHHPVIAAGRRIPEFFKDVDFPIDFEVAKEVPMKLPVCWWCHSQTTSWRIRNLPERARKEIFGPFYRPTNASK